ncbi:cytosol aminopeptidase-like [Lycorma delicatula]|uniref:cytosol aminopeptidase-like n=1 Tax=Lycorma delicatula TaxID=130591 RepID=UPI003F51A09B
MKKGLVLGVYESKTPDGVQELTAAGERLNDATNGFIKQTLKKYQIPLGKVETFSGLDVGGYHHIAIAGLGLKDVNKLNLSEQLNEEKENIRIATAIGARAVQDRGANKIYVDGATIPEAAAEGSVLGTYFYKANISTGDKSLPHIELYDNPDSNSWASGEINAESQNWARFLSHAPANLKKPDLLAQEFMDKLCKYDVHIDVRNRDWMAVRRMSASLSIAKSQTCAPPLLVEMGYCGDEPGEIFIGYIGKGSIFDSGGLFLKPYKGMHEYRADMSGAAALAGTMMAIARKRLPINVRCVILLYETMISPMGLKPGDVLRDRNGIHIRVSDPDNDCRVVLTDVLDFTEFYQPALVVNVGSYTKSVSHLLGTAATGAFTSTTGLWSELLRAGLESGDRVWRLPIWQHFKNLNRCHKSVDLDNGTSKTGGDCCQAAAFMNEWVPTEDLCCCPKKVPYIQLDAFGTGLLSQTEEEVEPYYRKDVKMGRPTRLLTQFLFQRACLLTKKQVQPDPCLQLQRKLK